MEKVFKIILILLIFNYLFNLNKKENFNMKITGNYVKKLLDSPSSNFAPVDNKASEIDLSIFGETQSKLKQASTNVMSSLQTALAAPNVISLSGFSDLNKVGDLSALASLSQVGIGSPRGILSDSLIGSSVIALPNRDHVVDSSKFFLSDPPQYVIDRKEEEEDEDEKD